jgi:hypothetical protein
MPVQEWGRNDQVYLRQKIVLLQLLNDKPERPSEAALEDRIPTSQGLPARTLTIQREKELVESLAFLASSTDDPRKVLAICVEETPEQGSLTVRMAANHGDLENVNRAFSRMSSILERVARRGEFHAQSKF